VDYLLLPVIPEVLKAKVNVFVELARQTKLIVRQAENLGRHNEAQTRQLDMIQKLNLDLKEANQELEAFSYSVSHDLRAPLRALKGYTDILLDDYGPKLDGPAKGYLINLNRAVIRMDALTRDLLNYSRIVRQSIELEPVNVDTVWQDVAAMNPALQPPNADMIVSPDLLPVRAHPTLLVQCLANLLDNAAKFVAPGVTPRIHIHTEPRGERVRIWLEDNGIGIDPAHHQKIFGIFERIGNLKNNEGTGIGLAIVARAVQRMGGKCGVESSPGNGSRFWIELAAV
jgi:signal transduction histidine kinase